MINLDAKPRQPVSEACFEHGKKLKMARRAAKKTLGQIADSALMRVSTVSAIERGIIHNLHINPEEWIK